jgi:hypothetical protein
VKTPLASCRVKPVHHFTEHCRIFDLLFIHLRRLRKLTREKKDFNIKRKKMIGDNIILC